MGYGPFGVDFQNAAHPKLIHFFALVKIIN